MSQLSDKQRKVLLHPIQADRVFQTPQGMSHLKAFDVLAHLNRIFGFEGWDTEVKSEALIFEDFVTWKPKDWPERQGWDVAYKATVRLVIKNSEGMIVTVKEDSAAGDALHQPSRADAHHLALTSAVSTALKRAANGLGDQFGLSLYDKGLTAALVKEVVPYKETAPAEATEEEQMPSECPECSKEAAYVTNAGLICDYCGPVKA
jgi:recombination DNA repair RAD52 pathway protein